MDTTMATTQTQVTVFTNEQFGDIRTLIRDGEPWFVAADCCKALGIKDAHTALRNFDDDEKGWHTVPTLGGPQQMTIVSEAGLYRMIFMSRKPNAKEFQRWVVHEVLPQIRKTGVYMTDEAATKIFTDPEFIYKLASQYYEATKENAALVRQNAALNGAIASLQPKADYFDKVMSSDKLYTVTQIAKDYGYTPAAFNNILHELGVQYKVGGQWVPAQQYATNGWTKSVTYAFKHKSGAPGTNTHTYWTEKGRHGLYELFKVVRPDIIETAERYGRWFVQ